MKLMLKGMLKEKVIPRENNFSQAGETYRRFNDWERDELVSNLADALSACRKEIQEKMVNLFTQCDADYGKRVAEELKMPEKIESIKCRKPLIKQKKWHILLIHIECLSL
jgi:catalase